MIRANGLFNARIVAMLMALTLAADVCWAGSATWNTDPTSSDWNTADNWTPSTVPNGPSDVATLDSSHNPQISLSETTDVDTILFPSLYSTQFVISTLYAPLNLDGAGVINDSLNYQTFTEIGAYPAGGITFHNSASAGTKVSYLIAGAGAVMTFKDSSSADGANIELTQSQVIFYNSSTASDAMFEIAPGGVNFNDSSSAGNATFTLNGGQVLFEYNSTAANANITCSGYAGVSFLDSATAAQGHFTVNGAAAQGDLLGWIDLLDSATGGTGTFVVNGGSAEGAAGAAMNFYNTSNADNATITVNGGTNGGEGASVIFNNGSRGGTAGFILSGNGTLDISNHHSNLVTIGSLAGDGVVFLGSNALTIGSNNQSTSFSGVIQDGGINQGTGGSLTKLGKGTLTLTGANTYTGTTTISRGTLQVSNNSGSGTGTGAVNVNAGTLAGAGILAGPVIVGTGSGAGAFLTPSAGMNVQVTLTIQGPLTFNSDATYTYKLNTKNASIDQVIAGGVTIGSGAQFKFTPVANKRLRVGSVFAVINNSSGLAISGVFANLPDGSTITSGNNSFQVSYEGGNGNDLTLTVLP